MEAILVRALPEPVLGHFLHVGNEPAASDENDGVGRSGDQILDCHELAGERFGVGDQSDFEAAQALLFLQRVGVNERVGLDALRKVVADREVVGSHFGEPLGTQVVFLERYSELVRVLDGRKRQVEHLVEQLRLGNRVEVEVGLLGQLLEEEHVPVQVVRGAADQRRRVHSRTSQQADVRVLCEHQPVEAHEVVLELLERPLDPLVVSQSLVNSPFGRSTCRSTL